MIRAGTVLAGRYRLEERIASGGMGEVWRAFDRVLSRTVAVKCLLAAAPKEATFIDRFHTEARTMATISHPGVVEVYDFGEDTAVGMYLVMKYIEGESLARALARVGRLSAEMTMRLVAEAAEALHAAHDKGVTHRDVKPGNLLLRPDGSALLTDFGIASSAGANRNTMTGSLVGTSGYIAPERVNGQAATARSDIYSLGVVAYRCLAGQLPFPGDNPVDVAMRHVHDEPPPLPADVPPRIRAVVERAMAKDPADRWPSGAVLAGQARRALAPVPSNGHATAPVSVPVLTPVPTRVPTPVPETPSQQRTRARRRGAMKLLIPAAAVLVTATIAAVTFILNSGGEPQSQSLPDEPVASATGTQENPVSSQSPASPAASNPVASVTATKTKPGGAATAPVAPKNLTATPVSAGTIRLRWSDGSADEEGFNITNAVTSRNVGANTTTLDWDGIAPATYMCFKVRAYNSSGDSEYFPAASMDWVCATTQDGVGPAAPTGLTATAVNSSTIRLDWTDTSANEQGFTITNAVTSRNVGANTTTYSWGGLAPNTYMCFKVRSFNSSGVSAYNPAAEMDWVCLTTPNT